MQGQNKRRGNSGRSEREKTLSISFIFFICLSFLQNTHMKKKKTQLPFLAPYPQHCVNCSEICQASRVRGHLQGWFCHLGMWENATGCKAYPHVCQWTQHMGQGQPAQEDSTNPASRVAHHMLSAEHIKPREVTSGHEFRKHVVTMSGLKLEWEEISLYQAGAVFQKFFAKELSCVYLLV